MTQTPTEELRLVNPHRDITENLRQAAVDLHPWFVGDAKTFSVDCALPAYLNDAADEIERLRAAAPASPLPGGGWQDMTCDEQFALATEIAANIGYVLQPEPDHPDCPHARQGLEKILSDQLNDTSRRLRPLPTAPTGEPK